MVSEMTAKNEQGPAIKSVPEIIIDELKIGLVAASSENSEQEEEKVDEVEVEV